MCDNYQPNPQYRNYSQVIMPCPQVPNPLYNPPYPNYLPNPDHFDQPDPYHPYPPCHQCHPHRNHLEVDGDHEDDDKVCLTKYDGGIHWKAWLMQFEDISERCQWGYLSKLGKLKELLKDEALVYCSYLPTEVKESYRQLFNKRNLRFGQKDTPHTSKTNLFILKQKDNKSLKVWAVHCMSTSMDAWQDESEAVAQTKVINAFLCGAKDAKASLSIMDRELATMDEAI